MLSKIKALCEEFSLKPFYSIALKFVDTTTDSKTFHDLVAAAPFIRQFQTKFVNYYRLTKLPPVLDSSYQDWLEEFYEQFCKHIIDHGLSESIPWVLEKKIGKIDKLFPNRPVPAYYKDIMRSLTVLTELVKSAEILTDETYQKLFNHSRKILSPELDDNLEQLGKSCLDKLIAFDARIDGTESEKFNELKQIIEEINIQINLQLMGNNTFVSIVQQITEINKALKAVRKTDFQSVLNNGGEQLNCFWEGLKEHGYSGGENYLYGNFPQNKSALENWLQKIMPVQADQLIKLLEDRFNTEELMPLEREDIPDAVQLYTINLLGEIGLKDQQSIKLVLSYHSKFVERMVREGAHSALKKNAEDVQDYFLKALGQTRDYEQMLQIADKHDTIFGPIQASLLSKTFGSDFEEALEQLHTITIPDGIVLGNFIRSAYLKLPGETSREFGNGNQSLLLEHFLEINVNLDQFRDFVEKQSPGVFLNLVRMWGLNYIVSWCLADYQHEQRLFIFIIEAAEKASQPDFRDEDKVVPLQDVITLLSFEADAKNLIQKLMTFLLNSKISFDYKLFSSLFQVVAQRHLQLQNGISIRDGFSEQRGYAHHGFNSGNESTRELELQDPHIFHPIVVFLITILHMKFINIPKDAFVETDISLYLNSLAKHRRNRDLGYQMYLAHQLISSIPYIKDFSSHHETVIRKTIADLDESYKRKNVLIHYHRIKIHRAPSKLDLDFCLEILEGLSEKKLSVVKDNLIRLMKGIGDEAIPDLADYFEHYRDKLNCLGGYLRQFKACYPNRSWQDVAEDPNFVKIVRDLPDIDSDSTKDIIALVKLANALSNYWTQRINERFLDSLFSKNDKNQFKRASLAQQLGFIKNKRKDLEKVVSGFDPFLEPYQHIFLKRHVIQGDWNFDFFGFWPYYKETKFESYNLDRKLAGLERELLSRWASSLIQTKITADRITDDVLLMLQQRVECLKEIMVHIKNDGLSPSKYFLDTIEIFEHDQLTISQLHDILGILSYRELSHVDSFIANTFGHFPSKIVEALGRENLDFGLDALSVPDEELFYPLVQETVLGNIIAEIQPIHQLESFLNYLLDITANLKNIAPSAPIYSDRRIVQNRLSPVLFGYKSYALQTLAKDGFNVPSLETIPVNYFLSHLEQVDHQSFSNLKTEVIQRLLKLEAKTEKVFDLPVDNLTKSQIDLINDIRSNHEFDLKTAPKLLVSARSGSYRSMPGILGTVLNIGYRDITCPIYRPDNKKLELNTYRMFLSTFGNVVFGINEVEFSRIIENAKKEISLKENRKVRWEDLDNDQVEGIVKQFKHLIEKRVKNIPLDFDLPLNWNNPLEMVVISTIAVWKSWDSNAAKKLREFLDISDNWHTPVTLMEMKQADRNKQSFSAILFSGDPQGKINKPHGDLLFGRPGEDIAAGLASEGTPLETLEMENPRLYSQITDLLEEIKINKGHVNVDVEMVGEFDPENGAMELFVIQERQMPLGTRGESEDYRLSPTGEIPVATGKGVNGGVQHGVFLDGVKYDYNALKQIVRQVRDQLGEKDAFHSPGIFLLMEYVTPEEALKMNIHGVDGVITTKIGKSSHASISAKRDGKLFVCEATFKVNEGQWTLNGHPIRLGNDESPEVFTVVGNPKSVSPYSGNIYRGALSLTAVAKKR